MQNISSKIELKDEMVLEKRWQRRTIETNVREKRHTEECKGKNIRVDVKQETHHNNV